MNYKVTEQQIAEILARFKQGQTVASLASEYKLARQTIYSYLNAAGIKREGNPHENPRPNRLVNKTIKLRNGGF